jgi:hypothetical protein
MKKPLYQSGFFVQVIKAATLKRRPRPLAPNSPWLKNSFPISTPANLLS